MPRTKKDDYYKDGYDQGKYAAQVNIQEDENEMRGHYESETLGEVVQEIREHGVQMAGDISYDISGAKLDRWEEGFTEGFYDECENHFKMGIYSTDVTWLKESLAMMNRPGQKLMLCPYCGVETKKKDGGFLRCPRCGEEFF